MNIKLLTISLIFSNLWTMEHPFEEQNIQGFPSLYAITLTSAGLKKSLKNIVKKTKAERKAFIEKLPENIIPVVKNLAIELFIPIDDFFKDKAESFEKIPIPDRLNYKTLVKFNLPATSGCVVHENSIYIFNENREIISKHRKNNPIILCDFINESEIIFSTSQSVYLLNIKTNQTTKIYDYPRALPFPNSQLSDNPQILLSADKKKLVAFMPNISNSQNHQFVVLNIETRIKDIIDVQHNYTGIGEKNNLIILTNCCGNILIYDINLIEVVFDKLININSYSKDVRYAYLVLNNRYILVNCGCKLKLVEIYTQQEFCILDGIHNILELRVSSDDLIIFKTIQNIFTLDIKNFENNSSLNNIAPKELEISQNSDPENLADKNFPSFSKIFDVRISLSPSEKYLILSEQFNIYIINLKTHKIVQRLEGVYNHKNNNLYIPYLSMYLARWPLSNPVYIYKTPDVMAQKLSLEEILSIAAGDDPTNSIWNYAENCNIV